MKTFEMEIMDFMEQLHEEAEKFLGNLLERNGATFKVHKELLEDKTPEELESLLIFTGYEEYQQAITEIANAIRHTGKAPDIINIKNFKEEKIMMNTYETYNATRYGMKELAMDLADEPYRKEMEEEFADDLEFALDEYERDDEMAQEFFKARKEMLLPQPDVIAYICYAGDAYEKGEPIGEIYDVNKYGILTNKDFKALEYDANARQNFIDELDFMADNSCGILEKRAYKELAKVVEETHSVPDYVIAKYFNEEDF